LIFVCCSIFSLPIESSDVGPVAVLPAKEGFRYPREKRVPEPKGLTVWEKFAKQKGIKNKKRERMVYDEQEDEYKPRFGYKGVNKGEEEHAIIEVKHGSDPYADPWEAARREKKEKVSKNEKQRLRNIERLEVGKGRGKSSGKDKMAFSKSVSYGEYVEGTGILS
jgi:regulator of ribosome biosynthesis